MKKKDFEQLKQLSQEELKQKVEKIKEEALKIKMEIVQGKIKNVHGYLAKRKEIAKILTLISKRATVVPRLAAGNK